ncbi:hypothetical protein FHS96_005769 [Sphingomonas zeicaulis]|uniref:hypothetical protein n=1 Tax=Sphingomonas zeicaulis TaxID=1632740 RepID=UPI003D228BD7
MTRTPDEIRDILLQMIVGSVGGDETRWRAVIGEVEELSLAMHPTGNWKVSPNGTKREREIAEAAIKILREAHPYAVAR